MASDHFRPEIEPYRAGIFVSTEVPVSLSGPVAAQKEVEAGECHYY